MNSAVAHVSRPEPPNLVRRVITARELNSPKSIRGKFLQDIYLEYFVIFGATTVAGSNLAQALLNPPKVV